MEWKVENGPVALTLSSLWRHLTGVSVVLRIVLLSTARLKIQWL